MRVNGSSFFASPSPAGRSCTPRSAAAFCRECDAKAGIAVATASAVAAIATLIVLV
jgi:hypothetical protein